MDEIGNDDVEKYIESIEIQHRQKTISIKQAITSLLTIAQERPELTTNINLTYYKNFGFTKNLHLFLHLINLCEQNVKFLSDKHVLCFLAQILAKFCQTENNNKEESKACNYRNRQTNTSDVNTTNNESKTSDENVIIEKTNNSDENTRNEKTLENMFNTDYTEQKVEDILITYIDDNIVLEIFDIFISVFERSNNVFLLSLLYEIGFFDLFFVINAEQTCKLFDSIYKNKMYYNKNMQTISTSNTNKTKNSTIVEVKRRIFDSQIVLKDKCFIDNKVFISQKQKTTEILYCKIINEFVNKNFYYFVKENEVTNMIHTLTFAATYFVECDENEQKQDFFDILYTDTIINGIKDFITKRSPEQCIEFYILLLRNSIIQKNHKIIISKLVCDFEINKKLYKMLEVKNKEIKKNTFVVFGYFVKLIDFYNKDASEKINIQAVLDVLGKENNVKDLFDILNYTFDEKDVVVYLLKRLYNECNKEYFYKISYLIIVRHVIINYDKNFADEYHVNIIDYLAKDKTNFVKLMFSKLDKKISKKNDEDIKDVLDVENKDETSDESSMIFRKRLNIG
ncbi:hypothetical protein BDAP_000562 [Binucleata daphniae]